MGKFLKDKLSTWKQEEIENLNSYITIKEIEFIIKNLPTKRTPDSNVSLVNSIKYLCKK